MKTVTTLKQILVWTLLLASAPNALNISIWDDDYLAASLAGKGFLAFLEEHRQRPDKFRNVSRHHWKSVVEADTEVDPDVDELSGNQPAEPGIEILCPVVSIAAPVWDEPFPTYFPNQAFRLTNPRSPPAVLRSSSLLL
ncbi:MAG: hypothetical protein K1Y36_21325 [Blastocatellia bacterium]|nr:hypothetical protein [Blastocatellia bacterium]